MSGIIQGLIASLKSATAATTDTFFNLVCFLLNTSSTNALQNNTFRDSSANNYTITRVPASGPNAPTQGTFSPFSPTGWSNYISTTNAYVRFPSNAAYGVGTGNFCVEFFLYATAAIGTTKPFTIGSSGAERIAVTMTATNIRLDVAGTQIFNPSSTTPLNTWVHLAFVRSGTGSGQTALYVNGTRITTGTSTGSVLANNALFGGIDWSGGFGLVGYYSNVRYSNTDRGYTGTTITVPTAPFGRDANTLVLTAQSNRFLNDSSIGGTPTVNLASVQVFEPFVPGIPYSTSAIGGSGYFDGSGDYLTVANATPLQFGTGDFTINCWIYRNAAGVIHTITSKGAATPTGWSFQVTAANVLQFTDTSTNTTGSITIPANTWTYVTVVRYFESGFSEYFIALYVNGALDTESFSGSVTDFSQTSILNIGTNRSTANNFNGYIAGFEYIKGSAVFPTAPPTAPPTTSRSPSLLLNFTNANIYDAASKNNLETVGTAQTSTTQFNFSPTSVFFNGAGNYIIFPGTQAGRFGSANWTIELFFRTTVASTRQILLVWNGLTDASGVAACGINLLANNKIGLQISENGTNFTGGINDASTGLGSALSANTWYYLAVTRSGATVTVYINGSPIGTPYTLSSATATLMANATTVRNVIGASTDLVNQPFSGYIDELRVTNGVARTITSTPTAAFPVQ